MTWRDLIASGHIKHQRGTFQEAITAAELYEVGLEHFKSSRPAPIRDTRKLKQLEDGATVTVGTFFRD